MAKAVVTFLQWYADTLVHYAPDSWVASTASTFRVLAFLTILPVILLTLLDVTSYVIARTLGDPTASTSARFVPLPPSPPPERANADARPPPPTIVVGPASPTAHSRPADELAGVGVFSPAGSAPSSPVLGRKPLALPTEGSVQEGADEDDDAGPGGESEGKDALALARDGSEMFGGESYALLERDESWDDAGVQIRRRARRPAGGYPESKRD
ncbi:hypothetical protein K488DRAFT_86530 [Vararia minispora EC-137]|uniref:Uncharacterized protein n=1 Tax=Vararia minispora EC-137 TaxID=1314806 RepID=A0ACB8QJC1_9AGAM|nr:hypothetical protein K488DRAFT_86530 [Vararia minispora EC-137]